VRKWEREGEGERCRICPKLLFLKGMTGALAPFSYLVIYSILTQAPWTARTLI
jgi:hypothetical protein